MKTVARWPWKSAAAKKCVTTKLPNRRFPKISGEQTRDRFNSRPDVRFLAKSQREVVGRYRRREVARARARVERRLAQISVVVATSRTKHDRATRLKRVARVGLRCPLRRRVPRDWRSGEG